ncbi:metadherin a [Salarias fasciatus]|uniref:metadherin a n=1 Tax=Salarias fasciatus TaxID=181472 RepID=UPI0011768FEC|nr:protein LYRIC-like [Salarias fasciatus]
MAGDVRGFALEKAEVLSGRLKELLSSGQGYVRAQFGVDLGLEPELYPTWVVLSTAAAGLLLLLALSWAAVCGGRLAGKRRGSPDTRSEPAKADPGKTSKAEEPKKRNKKKSVEKKAQSNGQPVTVAQGEVKETERVSKPPPQIKTQKVHEALAPAQVKKNKKKAKAAEVKPVQHVAPSDGKELDDGAWETKVSNREKRQQRRKDKSSEDSGSPGGVEAPKTHVEAPAAALPTRRNRGNHESLHARAAGKRDTSVTSSWRDEPTGNGPGWTDISMKISAKMGAMEGTKWSGIPAAGHYRPQSEAQPWAQEAQAWSGVDARMKPDLTPVTFSMLGLNTTDPISNSLELQWASRPVDDEWSGFNGIASMDPSSDWNAPAEHWGNYEAPPALVSPAPLPKEQPAPNKVSEDEKDNGDPSGGAAKSKKKRKKKKTAEEEADIKMVNPAPPGPAALKPQELPVLSSKKQNTIISSTQKKSEPTAEPPKPSGKKKARKET